MAELLLINTVLPDLHLVGLLYIMYHEMNIKIYFTSIKERRVNKV